jgi:hypothetical protein
MLRSAAKAQPLSAPHSDHAVTKSGTDTGRLMKSDGWGGRESA